MTKRDHKRIAGVLADVRWLNQSSDDKIAAIDQVASHLATMLERDNPNFSRDLFLAATKD